jgi:hypothetical protein
MVFVKLKMDSLNDRFAWANSKISTSNFGSHTDFYETHRKIVIFTRYLTTKVVGTEAHKRNRKL